MLLAMAVFARRVFPDEAARERYGVVLTGSLEELDLVIDWDETTQLRTTRIGAASS